MRRHLGPAEQAFYDTAADFIARHWLGSAGASQLVRRERWQQALVSRGWSTPNWPAAFGGPGWSATEKYLWHRLCAKYQAPPAQSTGTEVVAPLLLARLASQPADEQAAQWLAQISRYHSAWCVGFLEADAGADGNALQSIVVPSNVADEVLLNGSKIAVREAQQAQWMCTLVNLQDDADLDLVRPYWVVVDLSAPGITLQASASARERTGEPAPARVTFNNVCLPSSYLLAPAEGEFSVENLACTAERVLHQSAWLQAQLGMLAEVLDGLAGEDELTGEDGLAGEDGLSGWTGLTDEKGMRHRLDALAVSAEALQAMEMRYCDALQRGLEQPFPLQMLMLRGQEIFTQLGDLQMESFGYYALPYPDELLSHNEAPIGPAGITAAVGQAMALKAGVMYEEFSASAATVRDQLASKLKIGQGQG